MQRAIILNIAHAKIFAQNVAEVDEVISFCPSATYYLEEKRYRVTSTASIYGAGEHGEVVELVNRELPLLVKRASEQYDLEYAETEGLKVYLYHYLSCAYHLHFCLRALNDGSHFHWVDNKEMRYGDFSTMFASLAAQPTKAILSYAYTGYSLPHFLLAAMFNHITALAIQRSKRIKVIDYGDELPKRIVKAMIDNGDKPLVINTYHVSKNPLKTTRFFFKSLVRLLSGKADGKPAYMFRAALPAKYRIEAQPFAIPKLHDKHVENITREMVERFIPFTRTEVEMGKKITFAIKPDIAVSDHAKYAYILGGLEVLKLLGGRHAMLNHGTHTIQYDGISKTAALLWAAQERAINRNTTHSLPKSPLTAALVKEIRPTDDYKLVKLNVYGRIENKASPDGRFVILQAGNYTDAYNHIPWCKETADEYLLAIVELLEEVGKLENVELIIKLKNKKADTHKKIVQGHIDRLGINDKARVDTTSKFSDLMARAHIVVCNLSGTIEEALANNIPLMIHTYRKNYFHIAPETADASEKNGLAPAYLVKERTDIAKIIEKLTVNRAGLNDPALFRDVAWQQNELTSINDLAKDLVQTAGKKRK